MTRFTRSVAVAVLVAGAVVISATAAAETPPVEVGSPAAVAEGRLSPRPPGDLPLGHWAYPLLERLEARGIVRLDMSTLPLSRESVAEAVAAVLGPDGDRFPDGATERERWALSLLRDEFLKGEVDRAPLSVEGNDARVGLGFLLGTEGSGGSDRDADVSMDLTYELWGGAAENLGFYADTTILLEGQDGPRVEVLSSRARTWRGIAVAADRAYIKYERGPLDVAVGRRGVAWGRSPGGRLLISGTAPTLDGIEARLRVGPLTLQALHAFLDRPYVPTDGDRDDVSGSQTFLAAHRVVVAGNWGSVGVAEAVVYSGGMPDPAYLNPLLPYYVSQHNERENDNVLWSLDLVGRPRPGVEAWGEFVVDDLQYDRDTGHPDKYGVTVGAGWYGALFSGDFELNAEYTNVRKWTYTHHVPGHSFTQDGRPIGFELGPDADRTTLTFAYHPSPPWSVTTTYSFTREGEGDTETPFEEGENDEPTFPSGDVLSSSRACASVAYDDPGGLSAQLGACYTRSRSDNADDDTYELWARVGLRL